MSKNLINRIKETFHKFNINPEEVGIKLEENITLSSEGKLQDGTMIYSTADVWGVGADVYTKDESGNPIPVAAGEYILEDGTKVVVDDKGIITEFGVQEEEKMSSEDLMNIIESLSEKVNALMAEKTELAAKLAKESEKSINATKELSVVKTELSTLKKSASVSSIKDTNVHTFSKPKADKAEKSFSQMTLRERILHNIQEMKSN